MIIYVICVYSYSIFGHILIQCSWDSLPLLFNVDIYTILAMCQNKMCLIFKFKFPWPLFKCQMNSRINLQMCFLGGVQVYLNFSTDAFQSFKILNHQDIHIWNKIVWNFFFHFRQKQRKSNSPDMSFRPKERVLSALRKLFHKTSANRREANNAPATSSNASKSPSRKSRR